MNEASHGITSQKPALTPAPQGSGWLGSLFLGLSLVFVYLINGRELGTDDTFGASLLPLNILRGEGVYLENRRPGDVGLYGPIPFSMGISHGHIVTMYPLAPALVALPLVAPQVALLDFYRPGWDRNRELAIKESLWMVKRAMAVIVALAGVVLHRFLLFLNLRRVAVPAVLAGFLGSDLWTVGSQAPWQHGPAALALVTAIAVLHPLPASRARLALAGVATAVFFACRLMDIVFAAAIVAWLASTDWRGLRWFLPAPIVAGLALLGYNLWYFAAHILGGQARIERVSPAAARYARAHGPATSFDGCSETLCSPNRGLLVFSPWVAVALAALAVPAVARRLAAHSLICVLLVSLVPYLAHTLEIHQYHGWGGGHCFGPRAPGPERRADHTFAISSFAFALDWMLPRSRALVAISVVTVIVSITVQLIGAFCYPSGWNTEPSNVDVHHERLWDWAARTRSYAQLV